MISVSSFYPVIYALAKLHPSKRAGFDIMFTLAAMVTTVLYKTCLAFDYTDLFIPHESWHKLSNIALLIQFCSLIIYLARIPKYAQGYLLGAGTCLIIIMQERDSFSFKYALIPLIFNNLLLIFSQCMMSGPIYVNNRMVLFGAIWYVASILAFFASYHKLIDFFYIFDDMFVFSTGLSLFYSW